MKKSRVDIADKFLQNFTLEKSEKEEIEVLKQAIFTDYPDDFKHGNTEFNKGIREDYYSKLKIYLIKMVVGFQILNSD